MTVIDTIKSSVSIVQILERYCPKYWQVGECYKFLYPGAGDGSSTKADPRSNRFFTKNRNGDQIELACMMLEMDTKEAIAQIVKDFGLAVDRKVVTDEPAAFREELVYEAHKWLFGNASEATDTLRGLVNLREISAAVLKKYKVGYVTREHAQRIRQDPQANSSGCLAKDYYVIPEGRFTFPVYKDNKVVNIVSYDPTCQDKGKKYMMLRNIAGVQSTCFGLQKAQHLPTRAVVVTEGIFDALSVVESGENAVALLGLASSRITDLVSAIDPDISIMLCLDYDQNNAGQKTALRVAEDLLTKYPRLMYIDLSPAAFGLSSAGSKVLRDRMPLEAFCALFDSARSVVEKALMRHGMIDANGIVDRAHLAYDTLSRMPGIRLAKDVALSLGPLAKYGPDLRALKGDSITKVDMNDLLICGQSEAVQAALKQATYAMAYVMRSKLTPTMNSIRQIAALQAVCEYYADAPAAVLRECLVAIGMDANTIKQVMAKDATSAVEYRYARQMIQRYSIMYHQSTGLVSYDANRGVWVRPTDQQWSIMLRDVMPTTHLVLRMLPAVIAELHGARDVVKTDPVFETRLRRYIALQNGTIDSETLEFHDGFDPDYLATISLPVRYDPQAPRPSKFIDFLYSIFMPPEKERDFDYIDYVAGKIDYMQEFIGLLCFADITRQRIWLFLGEGSNGKMVLTQVLSHMLGSTNTATLRLDQFEGNFNVPQLDGKLVNFGNEYQRQGAIGGPTLALIKQLAGGEPMTIREIYGAPRTVSLYARLVFFMNDLPTFSDTTNAMRRRLRNSIVEMPVEFSTEITKPEGTRRPADPYLADKLMDEKDAIFNWALEGYKRLRKRIADKEAAYDLQPLDESTRRTIESQMENPVFSALASVIEPNAGREVSYADILNALRAYFDSRKWRLFYNTPSASFRQAVNQFIATMQRDEPEEWSRVQPNATMSAYPRRGRPLTGLHGAILCQED